MDIKSLTRWGVQQPLIDAWMGEGISTLTECQTEVFAHQPFWEGRNTLVVAPTSSGKTFVGEVLAAKSALSMKRAIFMVPFKAIAEEKYAAFRSRYGNLGVSVVISDADHTRFDSAIRRGDFGIAVIVFEKMAQLLTQSPGILVNCSLLVVDEIQMIGDQTRGPLLELLLTHVRQLADQPQMVGLSATMSDLGGIDSWLDADVIETHKRPVPLWEGSAYPFGASELVDVESGARKVGPDVASIVIPPSTSFSNPKLEVVFRILLVEGLSKKTLVFRTRVDDTSSAAKELAYVLPADPVEPQVRQQIGTLEQSPAREFLSRWIDKRVAYHNAGLSLEERRLIEQFFREGILRVLVTTSTLAAGVNTPADVAIVLDYKRYNFAQRTSLPISVEEYRNSVGRAGRFQFSSEGHSYLVVDKPNETHLVESNFVHGHPPRIRSSMPNVHDAGVLALRLLSLGQTTDETDLRSSIRQSFAFNHYFSIDSDRDSFLAGFMESLGDLEANELTRRDSNGLSLTGLGSVASHSGMSLTSFYKLVEALKELVEMDKSVDSLLPFLCQLEEFERLRPYDAEQRSGVLGDWVEGKSTSHIISKYPGQYELGSGHVRSIGETAAWVLNTASRIVGVPGVVPNGEAISEKLEDLAGRCRFGVLSKVVPIAELGVLQRPELNLLVNNSTGRVLDTPDKILDATLNDFVGILSPQRAKALQETILGRINDSILNRRFGHAIRADQFTGLRPLVERCYDTGGDDFEVALEQLLNTQWVDITVQRFGSQPTGQPDLEVDGSNGTVVIQVTASRSDTKPISWAKAKEVLGSVGYSGQADNFVTVGRPGFHDVAIGNATELADRGDQRLLLLPLTGLIEVFLAEVEGTIPRGSLLCVLEDSRGYFVAEEWLASRQTTQ